MSEQYTERFLAYCKAHNKKPVKMIAYDRKRWPGGCMCGYVLWIREKWVQFDKKFDVNPNFYTPKIHRIFDKWLKTNLK